MGGAGRGMCACILHAMLLLLAVAGGAEGFAFLGGRVRSKEAGLRGGVTSSSRRRGHAGSSVCMRFFTSETFKVKLGCEDMFEQAWRERENTLAGSPGFEKFMLLQKYSGRKANAAMNGEEDLDPSKMAGFSTFVAMTEWAHALDYDEWLDKYDQGRLPGGIDSMLLEPASEAPDAFDSVIVEPIPPEEMGEPWDFEENPDYFDGDM